MKLTGAQALIKSLEMEGMEVMFGLPGGAILPVYDPLIDSSIRHILVRQSRAPGTWRRATRTRPAVRACDGHERSRGHEHRHAARRHVHGLDPDRRDHRPGRVLGDRHRRVPGGRHRRHHDAGDEAQLADLRREGHPRICARRSTSRRRAAGPVLVDVPKDIANQTMDWYWPEKVDLPGYKPKVKGHPKQIKDAARLIGERDRPVIYAAAASSRPAPRSAARARRARQHPRRHHADGTRCSPTRTRCARHAGHARQLHRGHVDAEGRSPHRAGRALRRPRHRQARGFAPTPRSSTSTSTRPSWARCAVPTCRSW